MHTHMQLKAQAPPTDIRMMKEQEDADSQRLPLGVGGAGHRLQHLQHSPGMEPRLGGREHVIAHVHIIHMYMYIPVLLYCYTYNVHLKFNT